MRVCKQRKKNGLYRGLLVCLCLLGMAAPVRAAETPPANAVASAHPLATRAGMAILDQGGNAFDAAVAVTAALAVVQPMSSGLGGGGFWLLHRAADGKEIMIDGRERAPGAAYRDMYLNDMGEVDKGRSLNGPLAAGIPGVPAGIVYLAANYGLLPLKQSLAPAIRYAREGFPVTPRYQRMISFRFDLLKQYPSSAAQFLQDGHIPQLGYRVVQPDLGRLLERIAADGKNAFYAGETAKRLVHGVQSAGGIWSLNDLTGYHVVERVPTVTKYRGIRVVSASPPSSGGIVIGEALKILAHFDLDSMDDVSRKHYVIEAMRRAYRDRAVFLGDPDYVHIPMHRLFNPDYIAGLAVSIEPDKATPSSELGDTPQLHRSGNSTTHFSIIDTEGNWVSATLSVNLPFGSGFVPPGTGVLLNDEMDDFAVKPNRPNAYGLVGNEANAVAPGKRPLSSMSPTFLETPDRVGLLGTPGGSRIISMVLLGILDFADGHGPDSWVAKKRYHHQYLPDVVQYEQAGLNWHEQQGLKAMGYRLHEIDRNYGDMQAVLWDKKNNRVSAASDPRGEGVAAVEPAAGAAQQ
jgi:gamma-glutamyltranspeptidase/glutathione hydrolase